MAEVARAISSSYSERGNSIPEDASRLATLKPESQDDWVGRAIASLREDRVVLIQSVTPDRADALIYSVADALGLRESLNLQAAMATSLGHRENIGRYFMSVNKRGDYQFVTPHSEGSSFLNMQLSSFYCYENSTDGGETILFNVDESCGLWSGLRERCRRGRATRPLTASEIRKSKVMYRVNMPEDALDKDDEILSQTTVDPDFTVYDVLSKPKQTYSLLLGRKVYVYWDTIERMDYDTVEEMFCFLKNEDLLKLPPGYAEMKALNAAAPFRIRRFGSKFRLLFKCKITRKLEPGDLVIQNNLTWCHSVNNWTPGSGTRKVAAAFA